MFWRISQCGFGDELRGWGAVQVLGRQGMNQTAGTGMRRKNGADSEAISERLDMAWPLIGLGKRWRGSEKAKCSE